MVRRNFEACLEQLNTELIKMGAIVEQAINSSIAAFKSRDITAAREVIEKDRVIDDMEKDIESKCLSLILKQQPVARDLRVVSTALKIVTDMERIGDHASDIAELVLDMDNNYNYDIVKHIPPMAESAVSMVHEAIAAFVDGDAKKAAEIKAKDDIVDDLFEKVKKDIANILLTEPEKGNMSINFLMIAKYFERIGDHAENICDWIEFSETGDYKNDKLL